MFELDVSVVCLRWMFEWGVVLRWSGWVECLDCMFLVGYLVCVISANQKTALAFFYFSSHPNGTINSCVSELIYHC